VQRGERAIGESGLKGWGSFAASAGTSARSVEVAAQGATKNRKFNATIDAAVQEGDGATSHRITLYTRRGSRAV
jgi:hypothetical protein